MSREGEEITGGERLFPLESHVSEPHVAEQSLVSFKEMLEHISCSALISGLGSD